MSNKAQLKDRIMTMISDAAHTQRKHDACIEDLEGGIEDLKTQVTQLRGAIRPHFLPGGSSVQEVTGTAHCPLCDAVAPATLKFSEMRSCHVIVTARPIEHKSECLFAEENPDA